ncbi:MAG: amidohydrolase [Desulfatibacillaceae bacterium]
MGTVEYDLVVHNALLVACGADHCVIPEGLVCVRDGVLAFVGEEPGQGPPPAAEVIDAEQALVLPGLVNTHNHASMSLFRGMADDLPLMEWLNEHMFPAEAAMVNNSTARAGALVSCAEMLLSGTTCFSDGYFCEDGVAEAVAEAGMRAVLAQGVIDHPAPGVPDPAKNLETAMDFVRRWQGENPLITPSVFCHAPYTCSRETLTAAKEAARRAGVLFQIHVAETSGERQRFLDGHGLTPVAYLDQLGLLDENTLAVHCVWVDDEDIALLNARGAAVALATESNMKLASGVAPVYRMLGAGLRMGLGTDGPASNNDLDMFGEMGATARLQKVHTGDPTVLPAARALALATSMAADAVGLGGVCGSLEAGKRADIVVMRADSPRLWPRYDPHSTLVYAATGADVRHVIVDGRVVVRDRRITTFDLEEAMRDLVAICQDGING